MNSDRLIFNQQAEEDLLAAVFCTDGEAFGFTPDVTGADFNIIRLGHIYDVARALWNDGKQLSRTLIEEELTHRGQLDKSTLDKMMAANGTYFGGLDAVEFGRIVKACSEKRRNEALFLELIQLNRNGSAPSEVREYARISINALTNDDSAAGTLFPHLNLSQGLTLAEADYLVYGAIERNDLGMIYGDAAAGKTYLSIDLAVSLAAGLNWMNRWKTGAPRKVLYFIAEGRRAFFRRILAAVNGMTQHGIDVKHVYDLVEQNFIVVPEVPQLYQIDAKRYVTHYIELWRQMNKPQVDMFFVDTLARASVGAEENSSKEAGIVIDSLTLMQKEIGSAATFIHHSNRTGAYRGSSAYRGAIDFCFRVEGVYREPRKLTIDKIRDGELDGPIAGAEYIAVFRGDEASGQSYTTWLTDGEAAKISAGAELKKDTLPPALLQCIADNPDLSQNQIVKNCDGTNGWPKASQKTVINSLKALITNGEVKQKLGNRGAMLYYV